MTTQEKEKIKKEYWSRLKNMFKPEALKWIDEALFDIEMMDRWTDEEFTRSDILHELKTKIEKGEIDSI